VHGAIIELNCEDKIEILIEEDIFMVEAFTKKRVKNNGIVQQYYVENSPPPIINKEEFAAVQAEFERRSNMRGYSKTGKSAFTSEYAFSGKLFCQNCGSKFRRSSWSTGKNKQYVWRCINREQNGVDKCSTKTVKEKDLEQAFVRVMSRELRLLNLMRKYFVGWLRRSRCSRWSK
jgi:hypothetical protein